MYTCYLQAINVIIEGSSTIITFMEGLPDSFEDTLHLLMPVRLVLAIVEEHFLSAPAGQGTAATQADRLRF